MKIASIFVSALTALFGLMTAGHAAVIGSVSGPGGSGTVTVDDRGQIHVTKNFTTMSYLDLTFVVPANTEPDRYFDENITNSTGAAWSGFNFTIITSAPPPSFLDVTPYSSFKKYVSNGLTSVRLSDGTVAPNDVFSLSLGVNILDPNRLGYTVTVRETPIPEPASIAMLGLGALALIAQRRGRRNRRVSRSA